MNNQWNKTNNYYNRDVVKCDVYSKPFKAQYIRGTVYVMDEKDFMFTCSFGANSDYSYTGCFFECTKIKTVTDAMDAIDKIVTLQLNNKDKEARNFIDSLK